MKMEIDELKTEAIGWLRRSALAKNDPRWSVLLSHFNE